MEPKHDSTATLQRLLWMDLIVEFYPVLNPKIKAEEKEIALERDMYWQYGMNEPEVGWRTSTSFSSRCSNTSKHVRTSQHDACCCPPALDELLEPASDEPALLGPVDEVGCLTVPSTSRRTRVYFAAEEVRGLTSIHTHTPPSFASPPAPGGLDAK